MRGSGGLLLGALAVSGAVSGAAEAGPWAQAPGGIYARGIVSGERLDGEDGWRVDQYGEVGLPGKFTLTGKLEAVRYSGGTADADSYRVSVRRQLWSNADGWVIGAEGAAVLGSSLAGVYGCQGWGGEARISAGRSGVSKEGNAYYAFADAAWIRQEGGCDRQRMEFGYGSDVGMNFFTSQQLWIEYGKRSADSVKTETQIGYHFPLVDVALGYRDELGGEFDEQAILLAVTYRR